MPHSSESIRSIFREFYQKDPSIFIAPARINLIGEHTDYNEGLVMPAAIDRCITFAVAPNHTNQVNCHAVDLKESASFSLDELKPGSEWVNYLMGVLHGIRQVGFKLHGVDCVFGSTIPLGAGLSSSAALCCGFGFALSDVLDLQLHKLGIARIAQYAEHHFAGVMCGIMDQYTSLFGQKDCALLLDCRDLTHEVLPLSFTDHCILLVDTKVRHSLAGTAYNERRAVCEEGVQLIGKKHRNVKSLRDVTRTMLYEHQDELGEDYFVKCLYVVEEIARTRNAATLLRSGDIEGFGALLFETHRGLSQAYDVSSEELDFLVNLAGNQRSFVSGARMMGGGFGGCTINLIRKEKVDYFRGFVTDKYFATFEKEPDFYLVKLSDGVHQLKDLYLT